MQQMYNTIRRTGAENVIIVNGLDWAYDLSQVDDYLIDGYNIMYSSHVYNIEPHKLGEDNWEKFFGYLTSRFPVILTEFGQFCDEKSNYNKNLLTYLEKKKIHWTAWAWYVESCKMPSIISDYDGTPLGAAGVAVKRFMANNIIQDKQQKGYNIRHQNEKYIQLEDNKVKVEKDEPTYNDIVKELQKEP